MRFYLYLCILVALLPLVLTRPFFGLCVYYVVSLLQPKMLCWRGDFQDAMLVGVPMIIGIFAIGTRRTTIEPLRDAPTGRIAGAVRRLVKNPMFEAAWPVGLFVVLIIYVSVTRLLVPYPLERSSGNFRALCKVLLVVGLMTGLASDLRRFRILYIVVALATAFWAIKGGFKVILLGPHQVHGRTYDNNLFALLSVMALPMVFYWALSLKHTRWRAVLLAATALICLGIIGSRSRAGFVAFAFVLLCMAWSSRYRLKAFIAVGLVAVVALLMSGKEISERITSILEYQHDKSALSRFATWDAAVRLLYEHPLVGVGFDNFEIAKDQLIGGQKAAHNIFLQNAAELGLFGYPIWLTIILGTVLSLYGTMRRARRLPPEMRWAYYWSRGLLLGMLAFCIHGFFHNEGHLELMYVLVGLNVTLQVVVRRQTDEHELLLAVKELPETAPSEAKPRSRPSRFRHPGLMFEQPIRARLATVRGAS